MDFLTISLFFGWGLLSYGAGLYFAARVKPKDPRVVALGKRVLELQIEVADNRDLYERLMLSHKRLRSSAGMAKLRGIKEEKANGEVPLQEKSEAEILRELRLNRRNQ